MNFPHGLTPDYYSLQRLTLWFNPISEYMYDVKFVFFIKMFNINNMDV